MLQRRNLERAGIVSTVCCKWLLYRVRADCMHTCVAVFCQMPVVIIFFENGTVSFFIKLCLTHFAWNSVSLYDSPRIRGVCYHVVFYCIFLLIAPFVNYSSFMLPGLVLCLPHSATFLSLLPHRHPFSLQFQGDSPACLLSQCLYFL